MQLHHITVLNDVLRAHVLPVESRVTPHARVAQRARDITMNMPGHIAYGLAVAQRERAMSVGCMPRHLRVDPYDAQVPEQPRPDLAQAMTLNPKMKVLMQAGYFDLACPYRTIEYAVDHLAVSPEVRKNVSIAYYDAGHMMYVHPPSMVKFKTDVAAFLDANAR